MYTKVFESSMYAHHLENLDVDMCEHLYKSGCPNKRTAKIFDAAWAFATYWTPQMMDSVRTRSHFLLIECDGSTWEIKRTADDTEKKTTTIYPARKYICIHHYYERTKTLKQMYGIYLARGTIMANRMEKVSMGTARHFVLKGRE